MRSYFAQRIITIAAGTLILLCLGAIDISAQQETRRQRRAKGARTETQPQLPVREFRVEGGTRRTGSEQVRSSAAMRAIADSLGANLIGADTLQRDSLLLAYFSHADSLGNRQLPDSLSIDILRGELRQADSLGLTLAELTQYRQMQAADSLAALQPEVPDSAAVVLSSREQRLERRAQRLADTTRINWLFRDTIPISRLTWRTALLPGYAQLYNNQAWKLPIIYGAMGVSGYFWHKESKKYKQYKTEYDFMVARRMPAEEIEVVQDKMIKHNTAKQIFMIGAIGTWIYFIGDGAINYPGAVNSVKKATTLSTIFPGAGQIYNGSYWKVPIILGGIATMGMVIDWNNRGYKRFDTAHKLLTDGDENTRDEFNGRYTAEFLSNSRRNYRRNRDLCIIIAAGLYILNIIDAHVDAHMKDYDISDDLSMNIEPSVQNFYASGRGNKNSYGLSLNLKF